MRAPRRRPNGRSDRLHCARRIASGAERPVDRRRRLGASPIACVYCPRYIGSIYRTRAPRRSQDVLELAILGLLKEQPLPRLRAEEAARRDARPLLGRLVRLALPGAAPAGAQRAPSRSSTAGVGARRRPRSRPPARSRARPPPPASAGPRRPAAAPARPTASPPRGQEQFPELLTADDAGRRRARLLRSSSPSAATSSPRRAWSSSSAAAPSSPSASPGRAAPAARPRDRYTRSLVEHGTQSTERDLEWIDDLIAAEAQRPTTEPTSASERPEQEGATA